MQVLGHATKSYLDVVFLTHIQYLYDDLILTKYIDVLPSPNLSYFHMHLCCFFCLSKFDKQNL